MSKQKWFIAINRLCAEDSSVVSGQNLNDIYKEIFRHEFSKPTTLAEIEKLLQMRFFKDENGVALIDVIKTSDQEIQEYLDKNFDRVVMCYARNAKDFFRPHKDWAEIFINALKKRESPFKHCSEEVLFYIFKKTKVGMWYVRELPVHLMRA